MAPILVRCRAQRVSLARGPHHCRAAGRPYGRNRPWIITSMDQLVDSTTAANLPRLDADEWVAHLQTSIAAGALGKAARDADRDIELEP